MGKPMKSRILSIVLALSMLVTAAYALNASASVTYTGSVTTTDDNGVRTDMYFRGDPIYVNVSLNQNGVPYSGSVTVQLVRTTDGAVMTSFTRTTNNPDVGWYNSSGPGGTSLSSGWTFAGDTMTYDVVERYGGNVLARHPVIVKAEGLTLQPGSSPFTPYYPGETVTITMVTTHTTETFYVQVLDNTGALMYNLTNQPAATTGWWTYDWTIASDFPDGTFTMNVKHEGTNTTWHSATIYVQKYLLTVSSDRTYYLIGETAEINYAVLDASSMAPYTGAVITYSATWVDVAGDQVWQNDTLLGTSGTQDFLIPMSVNISSDVDITYWANETNTSRSYQDDLTLYTGLLSATVTVSGTAFQPGDLVAITVVAKAGSSNLPGADVTVSIETNATAMAEYGSGTMVTDFQGSVTHTFRLASDASIGSYVVNVSTSKLGYSVNSLNVFRVYWGGDLIVNFDKTNYFGGDNALVTFRTVWNGQEMSGQTIGYFVQVSYGVLLSGDTSSDSAQIPIPADYYGWLTIHASVNINGNILSDSQTVTVNFASIMLTTEKDNYRQGDTLTFNWNIVTSLTTANLEYEVTDSDGVTVLSGTPPFAKTGSFSLTVPTTDPPTSYTARLVLTTDAGGYMTASATVGIMGNYELQIWFGKSGYASGEFKPGQTVKVHYSINAYTAKLPVYQIVLYVSLEPTSHTYLVTQESGVIEYKIPKNAPSNLFEVSAELYNPLTSAYLGDTSGMALYAVNSELGAWDRSIGGMSAIDFTLLVLIIIMILLLIIVPFMKGRAGGPKAESPKVVEPVPPPSPPPSA
jgi:hypothetical protein